MERFLQALREYYQSQQYLLFERSIRTTNGRDHMQIQLIPFDSTTAASPLQAFQRKCQEYHLDFQLLEVSHTKYLVGRYLIFV